MKYADIKITGEQFHKIWYSALGRKHDFPGPQVNINGDIHGLSIIQIRCNEIGIANDVQRNNDYMITRYVNAFGDVEMDYYVITTDPKTKKNGMAFQLEQFRIYHVGLHKWLPWRIALRQDQGKDYDYSCWVRRYYSNKGKGWTWTDQKGFFTIHTHDCGGFFNSSLGCSIIANKKAYENYFKPVLTEIRKNSPEQARYIPCLVINEKDFLNLL